MILIAMQKSEYPIAIGWFDEMRMYDKTALLSPYLISTFPQLLKFVMSVIISLLHAVHVTYIYILFHYFFNLQKTLSALPLTTGNF